MLVLKCDHKKMQDVMRGADSCCASAFEDLCVCAKRRGLECFLDFLCDVERSVVTQQVGGAGAYLKGRITSCIPYHPSDYEPCKSLSAGQLPILSNQLSRGCLRRIAGNAFLSDEAETFTGSKDWSLRENPRS